MKTPKFVWLVLVAFAAIAVIAPQQAEAVPMLNGTFGLFPNPTFLGITVNNQVNTLDFTALTSEFDFGGTGDFEPFSGMQVTFTDSTMTWTGKGHNVSLINGSSFTVQGTNDFVLMVNVDKLGFAAFGPSAGGASASLVGSGLVQIFDNGVLEKEARMTYHIGINGASNSSGGVEGEPSISFVPEGGPTLDLLAISLVGLFAAEGLRRRLRTS
jgi:hypothetical protein